MMFCYKSFIVLLFITSGLTKPLENQVERCCFPKRYSTKIAGRSQNLLDNIMHISYDEHEEAQDTENGLIARRGFVIGFPYYQDHYHNIFDFKNGIRYSFDFLTKQCFKFSTDSQHENCIPQKDKYTNSSLYNYDGKDTLIDTWINDVDFYGISYKKVSRESCILLESGYMAEQARVRTKFVTSDFVEDIVDPTIFVIPPECH